MATSRMTDYLSESRLDENQYRSGVFAELMLSDFIYEKYETECMPLAVVPATFDETLPETVFSGVRGISRLPIFAVFQQRIGAGYFALVDKKVHINEVRVVTAHLGSAFSVGAFDMGRITDSNSPLDGEGPFSPTTSGTLPLDALIDLCYSGKYDMDDMLRMVSEQGGLSAYLEDASLESVMKAYRAGDKKTIFLVKAMAYQVAREIGARAAALRGRPQAITLTGNWTYFDELVREISSRVEWIAPVKVYTIDSELRSLAIVANETYLGKYKILLFGQDRQ
jgi:butyrate kinase